MTIHTSEIKISYEPPLINTPFVSCSVYAYDFLIQHYPIETIQLQEHFIVMHLNRTNRVLGIHKLSTGGLTSTIADIRILLSVALKTMATSIIISHNHPTGVLKPSQADILLTEKIREATKLLDIELLDHQIVSNEGYYSFAQEGKMNLTHASAGESVDAPKAY